MPSPATPVRQLRATATLSVRTLFHGLARLRGARVFHPDGVLFDGELHVPPTSPLAPTSGSYSVVARLSKAGSLPSGIPDVLGLAVRVLTDDGPWDFTFASSGSGLITRVLPFPALSWGRAHYSSLAPYQAGDRLIWLLAEMPSARLNRPASLAIVRALAAGEPIQVTLHAAPATGFASVAGRLSLHTPRSDASNPSFDPMRHHPPSLRPYPHWFSELRELAYRGSRLGRGGSEPARSKVREANG